MNISRALVIRDRLVASLRDLHSRAEHFGMLSSDMTMAKLALYGEVPKRAPGWIREYADGYEKALTDAHYAHHLVFGGFVDGVFYSTHRDRADYYERNGIEPSAYADNGKVTRRGHYWARSLKPFYVMETKSETQARFLEG